MCPLISSGPSWCACCGGASHVNTGGAYRAADKPKEDNHEHCHMDTRGYCTAERGQGSHRQRLKEIGEDIASLQAISWLPTTSATVGTLRVPTVSTCSEMTHFFAALARTCGKLSFPLTCSGCPWAVKLPSVARYVSILHLKIRHKSGKKSP